MLIRSRRSQRKLAQHRQVDIGQFQQSDIRQNPEDRFIDWQSPGSKDRRQKPACYPTARGQQHGIQSEGLFSVGDQCQRRYCIYAADK